MCWFSVWLWLLFLAIGMGFSTVARVILRGPSGLAVKTNGDGNARLCAAGDHTEGIRLHP